MGRPDKKSQNYFSMYPKGGVGNDRNRPAQENTGSISSLVVLRRVEIQRAKTAGIIIVLAGFFRLASKI